MAEDNRCLSVQCRVYHTRACETVMASFRVEQVLWSEQDVEVACPLVRASQAQYPQLRVCSFDHSGANRAEWRSCWR